MRGAATITSPAVMSAMRITPSSIIRDSGSISSLLLGVGERLDQLVAASRGPATTNSTSRSNRLRSAGRRRFVGAVARRGRRWGSDIAASADGGENTGDRSLPQRSCRPGLTRLLP